MEKIFGRTHVVACTAIGSIFEGDETQRNPECIFIWTEGQFHNGDYIAFNWTIDDIETSEDLDNILDSETDSDVDGCFPIFDGGIGLKKYIYSVWGAWTATFED
jgi:hypothetical protein